MLAVLALVSRYVNRKSEQNADLERQISEVEETLRLALEDGKVTDAKRLSDRLAELRKRLGRRSRPSVVLLAISGDLRPRRRHRMKHVIDSYGRDIHHPGPKPDAYMVETVGGTTYIRYTNAEPCAIRKVVDDGSGSVVVTWAYGAWADRAALTNYIPANQPREV